MRWICCKSDDFQDLLETCFEASVCNFISITDVSECVKRITGERFGSYLTRKARSGKPSKGGGKRRARLGLAWDHPDVCEGTGADGR